VTAENPITDLLAAPLPPDWTVEGLAEQVLAAVASNGSEEAQGFALDADATTDRQTRRLLRPLLACLASKSAAESGRPASLYGGSLSFKRPGPEGPVWIVGQFENRPGTVRVALRRSLSPPGASDARAGEAGPTGVGAPSAPSPPNTGTSGPNDRLSTSTRSGPPG
jgi:hypothetical protein